MVWVSAQPAAAGVETTEDRKEACIVHSPPKVVTSRRGTLVLMVSAAVFVVLSGLAFACKTWKGEVSILTPDGQADVTVHGDMGDNNPENQDTNLQWCPDDGTDTTQPHAPARLDPGQDFTVDANGASTCNEGEDNAELKAGTYDVTWDDHDFTDTNDDGKYSDDERVWGCMHTSLGTWDEHLGTMVIDLDGNGSATFQAPDYESKSGEAAAVCITHDDDDQGNMMPIEPTL